MNTGNRICQKSAHLCRFCLHARARTHARTRARWNTNSARTLVCVCVCVWFSFLVIIIVVDQSACGPSWCTRDYLHRPCEHGFTSVKNALFSLLFGCCCQVVVVCVCGFFNFYLNEKRKLLLIMWKTGYNTSCAPHRPRWQYIDCNNICKHHCTPSDAHCLCDVSQPIDCTRLQTAPATYDRCEEISLSSSHTRAETVPTGVLIRLKILSFHKSCALTALDRLTRIRRRRWR